MLSQGSYHGKRLTFWEVTFKSTLKLMQRENGPLAPVSLHRQQNMCENTRIGQAYCAAWNNAVIVWVLSRMISTTGSIWMSLKQGLTTVSVPSRSETNSYDLIFWITFTDGLGCLPCYTIRYNSLTDLPHHLYLLTRTLSATGHFFHNHLQELRISIISRRAARFYC